MAQAVIASAPVAHRAKPHWLASHWFAAFVAGYGAWILLPWLAPVFMQAGWNNAGRLLYSIYSLFCHQLPERSYFLFGQQIAYPLDAIRAAWQDTADPMVLRRFIGNEWMGWKVAWSDRMISFYSSIWLFALAWLPLRRKAAPLSWWVFLALLLPMGVDGLTHAISDLAGIGVGFRDTNQWLAALTGHAFPAAFYAGDAPGSFNSSARWVTGILAALRVVWFALPHMERSLEPV